MGVCYIMNDKQFVQLFEVVGHFFMVVFILFMTFVTFVLFQPEKMCFETSVCPVGKIVEHDFVCGKKILITEEYCRFFGGKLENGKCDATYSLHHRKRCETLGGVFVRTGWLSGECNFKKKCLLWQKYAADDVFSDYRGKLTAKGSWEDKEDVNG